MAVARKGWVELVLLSCRAKALRDPLQVVNTSDTQRYIVAHNDDQ